VNAGHMPPLLAKTSGDGSLEIATLGDGGPVLGLLSDAEYRQRSIELRPGDVLVLYSDGVIEATNSSGEEFGEVRLRQALLENAGRPCAEIRDEILRRVEAFLGRPEAQDDLTLAVARVRG